MNDTGLKFLYATAEPHPSWRVDVKALFGKYLPRLGISTDLVAVNDDPAATAWGGGQLITRPSDSRSTKLVSDISLQFSLFKHASRGVAGIIIRDKPILGLIGYLAARLRGVRYIYWMSFPIPESVLSVARDKEGRASAARRLRLWLRGSVGSLILYRFLMHRADWIFAQSDVMVDDLRQMGLSHSRISAVPMGVDFETLPAGPTETPDAFSGREVAIYMGTLDRYRKPEILIDAALRVGQKMPGFLLLLVGDTDEVSERGWLQQYARDRGALAWVQFVGRVPQSEAFALARHARVGLSHLAPSYLTRSTSPTKPLEYMALGLPTVCNDLPEHASVIAASGCGWCVDFTPEAFAEAILECLANPERARAMGESGRAWIRAHRSYSAIAQRVADTLRQVAAAE